MEKTEMCFNKNKVCFTKLLHPGSNKGLRLVITCGIAYVNLFLWCNIYAVSKRLLWCPTYQGHCNSVNKKPSGYLDLITSESPIYFDQCFSLVAKMGLISFDPFEPYCGAKCITTQNKSCGKNITYWNEWNLLLMYICSQMDEKTWGVVLIGPCDLVRSSKVWSS